MQKSEFYNRTRLLQLFSEKKVSFDAHHEIMLLFGNLKTQEQKEAAAEKMYPIVENRKTDAEAIAAMEEIVEQNIPHNRAMLLDLFAEKKFSEETRNEILRLFKQIDPNNRGDVLTKLYLIVESSSTEEEALEATEITIKQNRTLHRNRLLELTAEKQFCISNSVLKFIKKLPLEKREETAEKLYPIVAGCQTEDEAYEAVKQMVEQMVE